MHDALREYKPDTEVVDEHELEQEQIARPRVDTEDLIMHVRDDAGFWHRRHPVKPQTACKRQFAWGYKNQRSGRHYDPPLHPDCECWTTAEREEAAELQELSDLAKKGNVF